MRPIEKLIEKRKEEFIRNNLMSDEFIDFIQKNKKPMDKLLSYYACAIMEVETKFRVLDHQYSRNTTATRLKTSNPVSNPGRAL